MDDQEKYSRVPVPGLVKIRMLLNLSRPDLAKAAGCHPQTIANIEHSQRVCSLSLAAQFASVLACKVDDLLSSPSAGRLAEIKRAYHLKQAEEAGAA